MFHPTTCSAQEHYDIVIRSGRILDGSGNPWFRADLAIRGDRVVAIGKLASAQAQLEIDATGLYVAPGFIDCHSHAGGALTSSDGSSAEQWLTQGVTTAIINPDGGGPVNLTQQREQLLHHGLGINVAQLVPHGSVREEVIGLFDRLPTQSELDQMRTLVRQGMEAGAYGLSSGPFYVPGSYSDTEELVELAKVAAEYGGTYTSHIRDESSYTIGLVAAVEEVITVAREAMLPGVVTHIKALGPPVWGYSLAVVQRIEQARQQGLEIYADQYPYAASSTSLAAALLPRWAQSGGRDSLLVRFDQPATLAKIRVAMQGNLVRRGGGDRIQLRQFDAEPWVQAKTLAEVAAHWNVEPIEAALKLLRQGSPSIISLNMHDRDVETFMVQPWTMTSSDGGSRGFPHPRSYGAFPRKIRKYVVQEGIVDLPTAIRSMTALPAQVFRIENRGVIRVGVQADIVIFDLERLRDHATFVDPIQMSEGMVHVLVNGELALHHGKLTGARAGRALSKNSKPESE